MFRILVAFCGVYLASAEDGDSNSPECEGKNCPFPEIGNNCKLKTIKVSKGGSLSAETKKEILKLHNELRRKVAKGEETRGATGPQPTAENMRELVSTVEI